MALVVGLDLGTQSLKAVVCDDEMAVLGSHAIAHPTQRPRPDHAEQDPAVWEAAIAPAIAGALARAKVSPTDIAALAIAGQLDGCIAVDADDNPLHPALIWQDRRAIRDTDRISAARLFAITGQVADPSHMAPKIRWLRTAGSSSVRPARYHQPVSYLVARLTGASVMDPALASTTMLLELATKRWSQSLLDAFEIDARELPQIQPTCSIGGTLGARGATLTGLPASARVAVGTGDDFATPLGAGLARPGPIVCAIGTAEVVGALADHAMLDPAPEPMVETHAYPTDAFFVENPGWLSGGAVRWATRMLGLHDDAELDRLAAEAPPGADGVVFVPALAGAMTPVWRPHARGTFHGLAAGHERSHLARAVLEGLAFAARDVIDRLRSIGLPARDVLVLGGGAASSVWTQLRADVIDLPHRVAARTDTCAVGAAMIAAVAAGLVPDLFAAAALAPPPRRTFEPGPRDVRDASAVAYARYRRVIDQLAPLQTAPWLE